jgi:high-affinity Fe2+/Pb2+ permease
MLKPKRKRQIIKCKRCRRIGHKSVTIINKKIKLCNYNTDVRGKIISYKMSLTKKIRDKYPIKRDKTIKGIKNKRT